jgi:hypothetical protein
MIVIIGYTIMAIAGNGIPKIRAKSKSNSELHDKTSLISHISFEVSHALC